MGVNSAKPPKRRPMPPIRPGTRIAEIPPDALEAAVRLGDAMCNAGVTFEEMEEAARAMARAGIKAEDTDGLPMMRMVMPPDELKPLAVRPARMYGALLRAGWVHVVRNGAEPVFVAPEYEVDYRRGGDTECAGDSVCVNGRVVVEGTGCTGPM